MTASMKRHDVSKLISVHDIDVGTAVRQSRQAQGYSVEDLAVTCGLTDAEISRIEVGADIDPSRLRRIAAALQVPLTTFLPV